MNDRAFAAAACGVLAVYNNLPERGRWYPLVNGCAAAAALAVARSSGLTAAELGLEAPRLRAGLACGALASAPVAAAFAVAALSPSALPPGARSLLGDKRVAGLRGRQLAYQVLFRIPVGTVAWEEIAFRGVLRAALRRVLPGPAATATASLVFGVWHIRPTVEALTINDLAPSRRIVGAVVLGTAVAGAVLEFLRERSGSLAAPMVLHLTANCAGPLAAARVSKS